MNSATSLLPAGFCLLSTHVCCGHTSIHAAFPRLPGRRALVAEANGAAWSDSRARGIQPQSIIPIFSYPGASSPRPKVG